MQESFSVHCIFIGNSGVTRFAINIFNARHNEIEVELINVEQQSDKNKMKAFCSLQSLASAFIGLEMHVENLYVASSKD